MATLKAITESGKKITLADKNEIKRGGEGRILTVPELPNQVAKVYLNSQYKHMSLAQKNALAVLDGKYFVKPLELIYDDKIQSDILGFTMEYLSADYLPLAAFFNRNFCAANNVDEDFKIAIAQALCQGVEMAHQNQIIIGDLSGLNVLVTLQQEVKFLDVDSYETPVHTHWGLLFDEIRDYLYQGKVSQQSDYFALAVLVFSLFAHIHPFKGIHKQYKAMAERMVKKIPVFSSDPDLIVPKCYTPIADPKLQQQFDDIFAQGQRFLLQIGKPAQLVAPIAAKASVVATQGNLTMKEIYKLNPQEYFQKTAFTQQLGLVATNHQYLVYDCANKGYVTLKHTFDRQDWEEVFVGNEQIIALKQQTLYALHPQQGFQPLQNLQFSNQTRYTQIDNILVVLDDDYLRYVFLDEVNQTFVRVEQQPVFGQGFDVFNGLIQHVGGVQYVFYHSGKTLSTVKLPFQHPIKAVRIVGKVGLATYEEKMNTETTLRHAYFDIQGLQIVASQQFLSLKAAFGYRATQGQNGLVFEAQDDQLVIRRTGDFEVVQTMPCHLLTTETQVSVCQAGIVAQERDFCYLLNSQ
ncbi:MAG TPA: hypothetical protein DCM08_04925 [Microscillaceae bacterium]|nr:hypothetical protein [Microscillaceae bacterium]